MLSGARCGAIRLLCVSAALAGCGGPVPPEEDRDALFIDATVDGGVAFRHVNGADGELHLAEIMGSGLAWLDYDGDGDLDLYLVQGGALPGTDRGGEVAPTDVLLRNDAVPSVPGVRFVDVTAASGLQAAGYGMGVAVGDVQGDGAPDIYVTNLGRNELWRNRGDGTFEDVTATAGVGDERWSTSAAFLDFDGDDRLDLFVANYVDFRVQRRVSCRTPGGRPDYCAPGAFEPQADRLYRNLGDGTFADATREAGLAMARANGLGVVTGDFDGDGRTDLYVANDQMPNHLWRNRGDGTFSEEAVAAGAAVNLQGVEEASMGLVAGDLDGDGDEDLVVTHLALETDTIYRNDGGGRFLDVTLASGVGAPTYPWTGFGVALADFDGDGELDLFRVSGAVKVIENRRSDGPPLWLQQPALLLINDGMGGFREPAGTLPLAPAVGRGVAVGDADNDGRADLAVGNNGGAARLLLTRGGTGEGWLGVGGDLTGSLLSATFDASTRVRRSRSDGSYASAGDGRVLFSGLPAAGDIEIRSTFRGRSRRFTTYARERYLVLP